MSKDLDDLRGLDSADGPFDVNRVLAVLWRRRRLILVATLVALIPAVVHPFRLPPVFEATAKLLIQGTPEVMELGPNFMPGEPRERGSMRATVALAGSDAVLGRVADQYPVGPERGPGLLHRVACYLGLAEPEKELTPQQERQQRVEGVRRSLKLESEGGGAVLLISASGRRPGGATFLANATADAFVEYQREQRNAASRRAVVWLSQQIYELRGQVDRREAASAELLLKGGAVPLAMEADESQFKARLVAELQSARIELIAAKDRLAKLAPRVREPATGAEASEQLEFLFEQYANAQTALEAARLVYTSTHPEVRRLEGVVASLEARLGPDSPTSALDTAAEEEREYRRLGAERSRLEARVKALEKALGELPGLSPENSELRSEYERLQRELVIDGQMLEVLLRRRNETLLSAATQHPVAQVLDYAVPSLDPVGPNRRKFLILGIAGAVLFGVGVGLLRELLDRTVRDPEEAARTLGVPFLGLIPKAEDKALQEWQSAGSHGSLASESYRNLRTALTFSSQNSGLSPLVVTSAVAGEGKTTVSSNLAATFARTGKNVLLVDADLRRPRVHDMCSLLQSPGLAEVLQGKVRLEEAIRTPVGCAFEVLTSGATPDNPSELLSSSEFTALIAHLKAEYEMVLLDSPVLLAVSDTLLLAASAEGTLLVNEPGRVERGALERVRLELERAGAKVVGVVFNKAERGDRYLYPPYLASPYLHKSRRFRTAWRRKAGAAEER